MESHGRSNPAGKARKNMPFFKELAYEKFTQTPMPGTDTTNDENAFL
jgi:hypothetical protein